MNTPYKLQQVPDFERLLEYASIGDVWLTQTGHEVELLLRYWKTGVWEGRLLRANGTFAVGKWELVTGASTIRNATPSELAVPLAGPKLYFQPSRWVNTPAGYKLTPVPPQAVGFHLTPEQVDAYKQVVCPDSLRKEVFGGRVPRCSGAHDVIETDTRISECRVCRTRMRFVDMEWVESPDLEDQAPAGSPSGMAGWLEGRR